MSSPFEIGKSENLPENYAPFSALNRPRIRTLQNIYNSPLFETRLHGTFDDVVTLKFMPRLRASTLVQAYPISCASNIPDQSVGQFSALTVNTAPRGFFSLSHEISCRAYEIGKKSLKWSRNDEERRKALGIRAYSFFSSRHFDPTETISWAVPIARWISSDF